MRRPALLLVLACLAVAAPARAQDPPLTPRRLEAALATNPQGPEAERLAARVRDWFGGRDVLVAGADDVDWPAVLDSFAARGLHRVLCEGGPSLHGTLIDLDLVDEVCLTISPHLVAGRGSRIAVSEEPVLRAMRIGHCLEEDGVLLTRWVRSA